MKTVILALSLLLPWGAWADIYKSVDAQGNVTYSNVPSKGATKLNIEPPVSSSGAGAGSSPAPRAATPSNFPRVDQDTQKQRDSTRRQILTQELETEKQALEQAKKNYAEGESNPEVYQTKDGRTFRNVPKFEEKMKQLQDEVDLHQKNVQMLEKELNTLK